MSENSDKKPAYLKQLPVKSFNVVPGDVVGGLIFVMDKPLGIEEGMVGISVKSEPYRNYIGEQLSALKLGTHQNQPLQKRFNEIKDEYDKIEDPKKIQKQIDFLMHDKVHEKKRNIGMGGLLFEDYKSKKCDIQPSDHFATHISKLTLKGEDTAYMVKQDGVLILGGTGPGIEKILKTSSGKNLKKKLLNPVVVAATGGVSAAVFAIAVGAWKTSYLLKNKPVKADAIVETMATKIAKAKGFATQEIETIDGTYENGAPKIATVVNWTTGCRDLSGHLAGGQKNSTSVAVKLNKTGFPIKTDTEGFLLQVAQKDDEDNPIAYEKIDPNNPKEKLPCLKEDYDKALCVSDDSIYGLGESLINFISLGDRDGIGSKGQNKAIVPLNPSQPGTNYTHQFYGIDFGKAYKGPNPIVDSLQDDFSFNNPVDGAKRFKNYSMLYDNPLKEKMKGVYLLAALRGQLTNTQKSAIAEDYESSDPVFANKLRNYPGANNPGKNGDLTMLDAEIQKYEALAKEHHKNKSKSKEYKDYAKKLIKIKGIAIETDNKILKVFESRLKLIPSQLDILDNMEKLTAKEASTFSPDGSVQLNHIRVERENRIPWKLEIQENGQYKLSCTASNPKDQKAALDRLINYSEKNPNLVSILKSKNPKQLEFVLTPSQLNTLSTDLTEEKIAEHRNLTYRSEEKRKVFHKATLSSLASTPENLGLITPELEAELNEFITPLPKAYKQAVEREPLKFEDNNDPLFEAPRKSFTPGLEASKKRPTPPPSDVPKPKKPHPPTTPNPNRPR